MSILASLVAEFVSYYKAILSRSMFSMHALVAVWRTTVIMGVVYWSLALGVIMLVVEYFVTMWVRMGEEWPWISPSTLCYLATAAAALWVQKLESLGHIKGENGTYIATLPSTGMQMDFSAADWLLLTEQTMMVTIILSRWLLPKGEMTHKDLSSLLLLYLALSADILDFSTIFNEANVVKDKTFCYAILVVWSGSLVQFTLVLTNTATVDKEDTRITLRSIVCSSEIWQILVQIGLQDMPFLLIRIIALLQYQVFNFTIIFFVCKNSLVICLETYHLIATCVEQQRKLKKRKERMKHLKSKMASVKKVVGLTKLGGITKALKAADAKKDGTSNGDDKGGDKKGLVQNNALSLFASKLSKPKSDAKNGLEKQEINKSENENDALGSKSTENNKTVGFVLGKNKEKGSVLNIKSLLAAAAKGSDDTTESKENQRTNSMSGNLLLSVIESETGGWKNERENVNEHHSQLVSTPPIEIKSYNNQNNYGSKKNFSIGNNENNLFSVSKLGDENGSDFDKTASSFNNDSGFATSVEDGDDKMQAQKKPRVPQNLLFSALKKPGLKDVKMNVGTGQTAKEEEEKATTAISSNNDDGDDVFEKTRTGSQLATKNNNWLDEDHPFWEAMTSQHESPDELSRQNTIASIPPLSHIRAFENVRQGSPTVLKLDRNQTRDAMTPQSIFDDDDSVF